MSTYTIIYRRYIKTSVGPSCYKDFETMEEAIEWGNREFAKPENFDAFLRLPSGTTLAFTKMFGLV